MENQEFKFDRAEAVELFKKTAASEEARMTFAAAFSVPLLQSVQAASTVREIFAVDELPSGASAIYPLDFEDIDAWVMPGLNEIPQNIISGRELSISTFEIAGMAEWQLSYARDGRFDVAERAMIKLRDSIVRQEEQAGWTLLRAATKAENTVSSGDFTELSKSALNAMFKKMQSRSGYNVTVIAVNAVRAGDIREWTHVDVDDTTRREIWNNGAKVFGNVWGAKVLIVPTLSDDEVYAFDTTRVGIMPIKQDITTFDDPSVISKLRARVVGFQEVGFGVVDPNAIIKLEIK